MDLLNLPNDNELVGEVRPGARGFEGHYSSRVDPFNRRLRVVADSGGVIAMSLDRPSAGMTTDELRRDHLRPLIDLIATSLGAAEAMGRSAWDAWILTPDPFTIPDASRQVPAQAHSSGTLTIPASDDERAALGLAWDREFARACGIAAWEPGLDDR